MSEIYEVADAVTAAVGVVLLNSTLSAINTVTPNRVYLPIAELTALDTLTVRVFPTKDDIAVVSRDGSIETIEIQVGILKHLAAASDPTKPSANAAIDPLIQLARSIALMYRPGSVAGTAIWTGTKYPLMFDTVRLKTKRVFLAVITFTFTQAQ